MDGYKVWMSLSRHHTLVAIDMLGMDFSAKPRQFDYCIGAQADLQEWVTFERSLRPLFGAAAPPDKTLLDDFWSLVTHNKGLDVTHRIGRFWQERLALRTRLVAPLLEKTVPVRFINGLNDPNSGQHMADRYSQRVPGADVVRLEGVGHWPQLEVPHQVVRAARTFIALHGQA